MMHTFTTRTRFRRLLVVGAVVAGAIVPAAMAGERPPDVQDTASAILAGQMSPPDIRDAALGSSVSVPDVFERYAAAHPFGTGRAASATNVARPPDISDAALAVQYGSGASSKTRFAWGDWAIGIGSGLGVAMLLAAALIASRQVRHRLRTA